MKILIAVYAAVINIIAIVYTIRDKNSARKGDRRVPEKTLLLLGVAGGALGELLCMYVIRHKTRHIKFMLLLPLFSVIHIAAMLVVFAP